MAFQSRGSATQKESQVSLVPENYFESGRDGGGCLGSSPALCLFLGPQNPTLGGAQQAVECSREERGLGLNDT